MKSIRTIAIGLAVLGSIALALPSSAQVMNYQGLLTDTAGAPLDPGQYTVTFNIYDHPTNTAPANLVWGPFRFDGVARPKVNLSGGRFNVVLGPNDATSRSLTDIFNNGSPGFLGIRVGGNPEILPRQQILASPTAIHAQRADHARGRSHSRSDVRRSPRGSRRQDPSRGVGAAARLIARGGLPKRDRHHGLRQDGFDLLPHHR